LQEQYKTISKQIKTGQKLERFDGVYKSENDARKFGQTLKDIVQAGIALDILPTYENIQVMAIITVSA
jgi:hypothetical protein